MRVKKYTASSMSEAMKLVREELGSDAVIINSKEIFTGGFLGLFKKRAIEVIAANDQAKEKAKPVTKVKKPQQVMVPKEEFSYREPVLPMETVNQSLQAIAVETLPEVKEDNYQLTIEKELKELKDLLQAMSQSNAQVNTTNPEMIQQMQTLMINQEIAFDTVDRITKKLLDKWYRNSTEATEKEVKNWLVDSLVDEVKDIPFGGISFTKKFINVVGPTGVGKTTTLAKLAAHCVLTHKKRVAFITTDTYRIAAIDQLMTYAKILNVPLEVCYNIDDFQKATERFAHYDVVLIDTAGRNFRNQQYVSDLKQIIDFDKDMETFLVLAATSKQKDMMDIYEQFSSIKINKFIFTKIDETSTYGAIFNMIKHFNLPVAYITNGQNVPDDLMEATSHIIMNTIIGVSHV